MDTPIRTALPAFDNLLSVRELRARRDEPRLARAVIQAIGLAPRIPLPGRGNTLDRWKILQMVAQQDLVLAKLVEPHWDAQAILEDCYAGAEPAARLALEQISTNSRLFDGHGPAHNDSAMPESGSIWAVWAAEPPDAQVTGTATGDAEVIRISGKKAWCSGAHIASHSLLTYKDESGAPCLAAIKTNASGVTLTRNGWHAVGMAESGSFDVLLDGVRAIRIGPPHAYLNRPGFWHGGMGIAACWIGGARALACKVAHHVGRGGNAHALAHLGAIHVVLTQAQLMLKSCATNLDADPLAPAIDTTMALRACAEQCATQVLHHAGQALGAGPLCRDAHTARLFADLPVFVRQTHGQRDLEALGRSLLDADPAMKGAWQL